MTNRLLVEAGYSENYTGTRSPPRTRSRGPSATNPWGDIAKSDSVITSKTFFNAPTQTFENPLMSRNIVGSVSYVTGSHSLKMGVQQRFGCITADRENNGHLVQVYSNGTPLAVSLYNFPLVSRSELNGDFGLYIQDSWALGRLTLNPGLRYRALQRGSRRADVRRPAGSCRSATSTGFKTCPNFKDWAPRIGAAYDLFGNGKTGLKFSVGRYMEQDASAFPERYNPMTLVPSSVTWTDSNSQAQNCAIPGVDKTGCNDIADGALGCTYLTAGCEMNFAQLSDDLRRPPQQEPGSGPGAAVSDGLQRRRLARDSAGVRHLRQLLSPTVPRLHIHDGPREAAQRLHPVPDSPIRAATASR